MKPEIVIIAAVAEQNRVIGDGKDLPWHIPEDLKRFKRLTRGHPILMGRRTFESILHQFGKPLPDRRNLVLTSERDRWTGHPEVETHATLESALDAVGEAERLFIGGGANVYRQFLTNADRMELTLVEGDYEGDTYFPPFEHLVGPIYEIAAEEAHPGFRFVSYVRA